LCLAAAAVIFEGFWLYFVFSECAEILGIEVFVTKQERLKRDSLKQKIKKNNTELSNFIAANEIKSDKINIEV